MTASLAPLYEFNGGVRRCEGDKSLQTHGVVQEDLEALEDFILHGYVGVSPRTRERNASTRN